MELTIAIICSNDHLLKKCLDSIPQKIPIIVILNFPDQYVLDIIKKEKRVIAYRCDERNLGKLRQLAVDVCKTKNICFIDSDCIITKNAIQTINKELKQYYAVNIPLDFDNYNLNTKIVALCRKYTTPDNLLYMPFAFRIDVQKKIGKLFNDKLLWGEDTDQRLRLKEKGIKYCVSKGRVLHKALTIKEDSKSSKKLGYGTYIQVINGIIPPRKFLRDINIFYEIKEAYRCSKNAKSIIVGFYHFFVWRTSYKYGYWKEVVKHGNKCKNNKKRK